jgi:anti-sigma factor RsiW
MTTCRYQDQTQAYLDGELPAEQMRVYREHLAGCASCAAELALYRRVFALLEDAPQDEPSPDLTERVLESVLPSRILARRARRLRAFGWSYAGMLAASVAGFVAWAGQPSGQAVLSALSSAASKRLVEAVRFVVNAASFAFTQSAAVGQSLGQAFERFSPLGRALAAALGQSTILGTLAAALAVSAVMLWWLRPSTRHHAKEIHHVGVLGF